MPLALKALLAERGYTQKNLAQDVGVSPATIAQIVNHNLWPNTPDKTTLKGKIRDALLKAIGREGWSYDEIFTEVDDAARQPHRPNDIGTKPKDTDMLLRRAKLTQEAREAFHLTRDPFRGEINEAADVFMSADMEYIFESMWQAVQTKQTDFVAIVGESGSGKTTLRDEMLDRIRRENHKVHVIQPASIAAMEASDKKGHTLKAASIAQAIIATVSPQAKIRRDQEALYRQVTRVLMDSSRAGYRHMLMIDEAHCLPTPTLKHLKRFYEFKDGHQGLLSIVLIGQPELAQRLDERNPEVREVTQRCWLTRLQALDASLEDYIHHKFARAGRKTAEFLEADAFPAIREALLFRRNGKGASGHVSYLYPLAVNNLLTEALNAAAKVRRGQKVDAGIIKGVREDL